MRTDTDHLPPGQRGELERITKLLLSEFAKAISLANQPWKKNGKILKIILFGSYARSDWVDEPKNGYQSDFDILVVVSHPDLTDIADYWYVVEDKILRDDAIARPVNIIVHTLEEVNQGLSRGAYFWTDIARDGISLYELSGSPFAVANALTAADAFEMATTYFNEWLTAVDRSLATARRQASEGLNDLGWRKDAAFTLHQATERAYACFLLVRKLYFPRSHNIKFLRSLAEDSEQRLIEAWPRSTRLERRYFELVRRAYVEARYSASYAISNEDLAAIGDSVHRLRDIVDVVCRERVEMLREAAGL